MQVGPETRLQARLAIYRDGEPQPEVEEVQGTGPAELIHKLCTRTMAVIREVGGDLPQPPVEALLSNLVHAGFRAATVSVLAGGHTLRVSDGGPGIADKSLALEPGFSSAREAERELIAGVGAGLAVAARYAAEAGGRLDISDNLGSGTVVTLTLAGAGRSRAHAATDWVDELEIQGDAEIGDTGKRVLLLLAELGGARLETICDELRLPADAVERELRQLGRLGLLDPHGGKQMLLTPAGLAFLDGIFAE